MSKARLSPPIRRLLAMLFAFSLVAAACGSDEAESSTDDAGADDAGTEDAGTDDAGAEDAGSDQASGEAACGTGATTVGFLYVGPICDDQFFVFLCSVKNRDFAVKAGQSILIVGYRATF